MGLKVRMEWFSIPHILANLQVEKELLIIYKGNHLFIQDLEELEMENHLKKYALKTLYTD